MLVHLHPSLVPSALNGIDHHGDNDLGPDLCESSDQDSGCRIDDGIGLNMDLALQGFDFLAARDEDLEDCGRSGPRGQETPAAAGHETGQRPCRICLLPHLHETSPTPGTGVSFRDLLRHRIRLSVVASKQWRFASSRTASTPIPESENGKNRVVLCSAYTLREIHVYPVIIDENSLHFEVGLLAFLLVLKFYKGVLQTVAGALVADDFA